MSIVLNEYEWAGRAIKEHDLGRKPYETLSRVAKYYLHDGMDKKDVRIKLDEFLMNCDAAQSLVKWSDTLDRAVKYAVKYPTVHIDYIPITKNEIDTISKVDGVRSQRLAFVLLCIAKYMKIVSPHTEYWVSTPDSEIMKMANITTNLKSQSAMFRQLRDAGLIKFSKRIDNLSVQVLFANDVGDVAIKVSDFRNLGNQYMMYCGGKFYQCEECGLVCRITNEQASWGGNRNSKYCKECAAKVHTKQMVDAVMRMRKAKNGTVNNSSVSKTVV